MPIFAGGVSLQLLKPFWAAYFKKQDLLADRFAKIAFRDELLAYLEVQRQFDGAVPYGLIWQASTPVRIDRILHN